MRTMVRIIAVIAVIAVALSLGAVRAADPLAGGRGPALQFELTDGTVITGRIDVKTIAIRIASGSVLKIPVTNIKELTVGLNDRPKLVERVETLVKALDSAKTREDAKRELVALGPAVAPIVKRHVASDVSARRSLIALILKAYESWSTDHPDAPETMARPLEPRSKIRTEHNTFLGTVTVRQFKIASPYGSATVKLTNVYRIRPADVRSGPAAPGKLGQWVIELRDKTRLKGMVVSKTLRIRTRYGTMVVPFGQAKTATFTADGKNVRVQCRNSDRIVGALWPGTTISLKTDKGRADLSARKIAVAAYKPLTLDLGKGVTLKLVLIPAGKFLMGSPKTEARRRGDEGPLHEVTISKVFYMGIYEVTQAQWRAVMGAEPGQDKKWTKSGGGIAASHISWDDASKFCRMLSKKTGRQVALPTEAQWEYACRAGSKTAYSFGDDASKVGDYAWYLNNADKKDEKYAHAAGQKKPNAWGLYDMHGNVWEWCRDWRDPDFYLKNKKNVDPENTTEAMWRVVRGGGWRNLPCRAALRHRGASHFRGDDFGFRVVVASGSGVD